MATAYDRFGLETAIMNAWNTADDLGLLVDAVMNDELDTDELANTLLGLQQLHQIRSKKAFEIFESMISSGQIT
jgi:hypothetical protein